MVDPTERTALYRLRDADGRLLYIGIAKDPERRWKHHSRTARATWWPDVADKSVQWFNSRAEADEAETVAISNERPLHNRAKRERPYRMTFNNMDTEIDWVLHSKESASQQVARILRTEIRRGVYSPGDRMPTGQDLVERFGVTPPTVSKAMRALAAEGRVRQERARGPYYAV